jgi:TRAP-type C4-dicarboxylate transport system permease small subunit
MIHILDRLSAFLARVLTALAGVFLVGMVALACANMILRAVWVPIQGTFELMGFMGAVVAAFSLAFAQRQRSHVAVGVLLARFPRAVRRAAEAGTSLVSCVFFGIAGVETWKWASFLVDTGEVSETLTIIFHPFVYASAFGCLALTFVLAVDTLKTLTSETVE